MDLYPYTYFNAVQTQIFWTLFHTDVSVLVGAPTGSGKTVAAELAILRELELQEGEQSAFEEEEERKGGEEKQNGEKENQKGKRRKKGMKKIVYIGPMKALVHERVKDWTKRFGNLGVEVIELTGEASPSPDLLRRADILCTTPEKWDGTSRQVFFCFLFFCFVFFVLFFCFVYCFVYFLFVCLFVCSFVFHFLSFSFSSFSPFLSLPSPKSHPPLSSSQ